MSVAFSSASSVGYKSKCNLYTRCTFSLLVQKIHRKFCNGSLSTLGIFCNSRCKNYTVQYNKRYKMFCNGRGYFI